LRGYPSSSGSKPERTDLSGEAPYSAENKTNISSDDWEPSVPFRPSFFMTTEIASSSGNQYDPLRDSIETPNTTERSFKFIFSASGSSTKNSLHQRAYGDDSTLAGAKVPDNNDDKISGHVKSHECIPEKNSDSHGKDSHTSVAETVGTSMVDGQNVTSAEEIKPSLSSLNAKDVAPSTKINDINQRARQQNEAGFEHNITDGEVQKESKVMRYFRASLIDLVKELLKPAWHKGTLSRDAHNLIVKKAVDKVLSTLQPHQTVSIESVSQYLSFSRPKISKLVEAYVEKYDKS
jgi:hypothetical protein